MERSRMIRTLAALVAAMTVGTLVLMVMQTDPIIPTPTSAVLVQPAEQFRRVSIGADTALRNWRNIVVHSSANERSPVARGSHFTIAPNGDIRRSSLWMGQNLGAHVARPRLSWNRDSIGICLIGDFSAAAPTAAQYKAVIALARNLQKTLGIPAGNVYLSGQIGQGGTSPGRAFPVKRWTNALLGARAVR